MAFKDLRDYIKFMKSKGKIIEVDDSVDANLEIAEINRSAAYMKSYPLLFKNVKGFKDWNVITNVYYSMEGIYEIFGTKRLESFGEELINNMNAAPATMLEKVKSLPGIMKLGAYAPKIKKPEFKERDANLDKIPALKTWPLDAGRYFTLSLVMTKDPLTRINNFGIYRVQLLNKKEAIIHWQAFKRGAMTAAKYKEMGINKVPVAIVNGIDPITTFVGASPVPHSIDKYLFAGILRNDGVCVHKLKNGIFVPSYAESVMEGYVDLNDMRTEGPFGDHLGYYTPQEKYPVFKLEKFYSRDSPIFHATSVGKPPLEDAWIGKAVERIFLPFVKMAVPDIVDMNLPEFGLFNSIGIFSINKRYAAQAKRVMMAIWGTGQLSFLKFVIIVDKDVEIQDMNNVLYAMATTVDPSRDVLVVPNAFNDTLDHTVPNPPLGSKIGIDATRKFKEELGREWPKEVESDKEIIKKAASIIKKIEEAMNKKNRV